MHTRQEWEKQEFDVCEGSTHDIKPYSASEYSDNEFVNILHDAALPHSDSPYSLYGSRIPPLKHG